MMNTKKTKSNRDVFPDHIQDKDVKVHISIKLDFDVLNAARENANKLGMKYQTYINHLLRQVLIDDTSESVLLYVKGLAILKEQIEKVSKKKKKGA